MLSEGVTVEAIGREDERAWKPPVRTPAAEHDLSAAQGLKGYMTSDKADHLQYVKKVTSPPVPMDQLMADIGAELDEDAGEDGEAKRKEA